jgi:rubrerythrin
MERQKMFIQQLNVKNVRIRQTVKLPAVQPVVMWTPALGRMEKIKMFDSDICKKKDGTSLKSYESEFEADETISYVKSRYGNDQVKYKCSKCGYWHLSPKERQTPNHKSNCLDSQGKIKQAYSTRESAETRAKIIYEEKGKRLFVYKCDLCGEFHLTHTQY